MRMVPLLNELGQFRHDMTVELIARKANDEVFDRSDHAAQPPYELPTLMPPPSIRAVAGMGTVKAR